MLGALGAGLVLAHRHPVILDWTGNQRHGLSAASRAALDAVAGPLTVSVYLPAKHNGRASAKALVARYQRVAPRLTLRFVDPLDVPDLMRKEELRVGEMVLTSGERRERIPGDTCLLEGGAVLNGQMLAAGLVDEVFLTYAPRFVSSDATRIALGPPASREPWLLTQLCVDDAGFLFARYERDTTLGSRETPLASRETPLASRDTPSGSRSAL
ncbi:MAG: hypothetical protein EBT17_06145 [Actinobacteria bacterium]|nr:hypothetical protein [Actinomycetota bacterium]